MRRPCYGALIAGRGRVATHYQRSSTATHSKSLGRETSWCSGVGWCTATVAFRILSDARDFINDAEDVSAEVKTQMLTAVGLD